MAPVLLLLELALATALAAIGVPAPQPGAPAQEDGTLVLVPPGEQVEDWYVLEVQRVGPDGRPRSEAVGTACLRRSETGAGLRLEAEYRHPQVDARILIVEEPTPGGRRLVYRELVDRAGRSVVLERIGPARWSLLEWGGPRKLRQELDVGGPLALPLELAERARRGRVDDGPLTVYDPLAGRPVTLRARLVDVATGPEDVYEVRYERADGTLAASYRIRAGKIVEFSTSRGGPRARLASYSEVSEAERRLRTSGPS